MRFSESLRLRIEIWHGLLLAATLTALAVAAYRHQAADDLRRVDDGLRERGRVLKDLIAPPRRPDGQPPPGPGAPRDFRPQFDRVTMFDNPGGDGVYYAVWGADGSLLSHSSGTPADIERPVHSPVHLAVGPDGADERPPHPPVPPEIGPGEFDGKPPRPPQAHAVRPGGAEPFNGGRTRGVLREAFMFTPGGECLLVGRSMEPEQTALKGYGRWLAAISASVLALGLAVGWWITTEALRPIGMIVSTAKKIARGELGERIPVRQKSSELGRLSVVLNETFSQLEESFERQSRFTADAAHELRTPVAIILTQAQHALMRERDGATYKLTLEACVSAARRLRQLTESLLELTTMDAGAVPLKLEGCDLADIARDVASMLQPLAAERGIEFTGELLPSPCDADAARISQVMLNLLTNALDHTTAGGRVTFRTGMELGGAIFSVSDTGAGIAAEHLPRIFDRFYRTDDSRNRRTGGAGLGLAICKAIADAHGAKLEVKSVEGGGSTFVLQMPVRLKGLKAGG